MGSVTCALFFLRFWRRTREGLFLAFALAFILLGAGQALLTLGDIPTEERGSLYIVRLAAYLLILTAIYQRIAALEPETSQLRLFVRESDKGPLASIVALSSRAQAWNRLREGRLLVHDRTLIVFEPFSRKSAENMAEFH